MSRKQQQTKVVALSELDEWELNPRRGVYRDMERLEGSLAVDRLMVPLDVWRAADGRLKVLQGHRRLRAMRALGWTEISAEMVRVREFTDEAHALAWLMSQQENSDPFDAVERSLAVTDMLRLGLGMEETCVAVGRSEETVQMWLRLGEMPDKVQAAVKRGEVSLETVKVLAEVEASEQVKALQLVLAGPDGMPMGGGMARKAIEHEFLIPARQRKQWEAMRSKLKRKHPADEGYVYVEWEDRNERVMGPTGHPQDKRGARHEWANVPVGKSNLDTVVTWEDAAKHHGAPIYMAPAGEHKDGFVLLVNMSMVQAADERSGGAIFGVQKEVVNKGGRMVDVVVKKPASVPAEDEDEGDEETPPLVEQGENPGGEEAVVTAEQEAGWSLGPDEKAHARKIMALVFDALVKNMNKNMTGQVWEPLMPYVLGEWVGEELARAFTGGAGWLAAYEADTAGRSEMRWALMRALCSALWTGDMVAVEAVLAALGIELV